MSGFTRAEREQALSIYSAACDAHCRVKEWREAGGRLLTSAQLRMRHR